MRKNTLLEAALIGSSSALGLNWIYDRDLLLQESKNGAMIFRCIDHDLYKKAQNSYDVYPNHKVGQLDFMGEVLYLFHMFHDYENDKTLGRWMEYFYEYFREDNEYDGYIESYGKDLLTRYKASVEKNEKPKHETDHIDKQLAGLLFLLHLYESPKSVDKVNDALRYARTITGYVNITQLTIMLHELLKKLDYGIEKSIALNEVISLAPYIYQKSLYTALTMDSTEYLKDVGIACGIDQSLPLIFHIVNIATSWEKGMELNATLGGASSARGIFISALLSRIYEIPYHYTQKLEYKI